MEISSLRRGRAREQLPDTETKARTHKPRLGLGLIGFRIEEGLGFRV